MVEAEIYYSYITVLRFSGIWLFAKVLHLVYAEKASSIHVTGEEREGFEKETVKGKVWPSTVLDGIHIWYWSVSRKDKFGHSEMHC